MAVHDPQTEWLRVQIYRQMSPQQRMWLAVQMYEDSISIIRSAILDRHPTLTQNELERRIRRRLLPPALFRKVEAALAERNIYDAT